MHKTLAVLALTAAAALPARADIHVGVVLGTTGPGAGIGIAMKNGLAVAPPALGGEKVVYTIVDDATDPGNAARLGRRLVTEDKVDLLIGPSNAPGAVALAEVANELQTPLLALSPLPPSKNAWTFQVPQSVSLMVAAVVRQMAANGIKTVGYIGFADTWGDLNYNALTEHAGPAGIKLVANERYGRLDTAVGGQVLKLLAANPDAVFIGASSTPAVLPHATLLERGYKGKVYHSHAVTNRDFVRVGGKTVEGSTAATGPVVVAESLPDDHPSKPLGLAFLKRFEAAHGPGSRNAFSANAYDAMLIADRAVAVALKTAKPRTPAFRQALRDAIETTHGLVATHGVYTLGPTNHTGLDARAAVLVTIQGGEWKLVK